MPCERVIASGLWQARTFREQHRGQAGRTPNQIMCKATRLGLKWPLEFRANLRSKPALTDRQKAEARRRMAAGESARSIARDFDMHPGTVGRLRRK